MELPERDDVVHWVGRTVTDVHGETVGPCRHVYADEATGVPEWLVVEVDGGRGAFVPLTDARSEGDSVHVAFARSAIAGSPAMGDSGHLAPEQDVRLYEHYGLPYSREASPTIMPTAGPEDLAEHSAGSSGATAAGVGRHEATSPPLVAMQAPAAAAPAAAEPLVVTPAPAPTRAPAPAPRPAAPAAKASSTEPLVLGGLALAAAVAALLGLRKGRRHQETPREKAVRQARETAAQVARASAVKKKDLAVAGRELARTAAAKRDELAKASEPRRQELATTAAAKRKELTVAAAARGQELARTGAVLAERGSAKRDELAKAGAARRKELAKAGAARRKELAKAGAATRGQLARTTAERRAQLVARREELAKAAKARRKEQARAAAKTRTRRRVRGLQKDAGSAAGGLKTSVSDSAKSARKTGSALSRSSGASRGPRKVRRAWRRTARRATLLVGLGSGYVVGARAGHERYEQIVQLTDTPQAQQVKQQVAGLLGRRQV